MNERDCWRSLPLYFVRIPFFFLRCLLQKNKTHNLYPSKKNRNNIIVITDYIALGHRTTPFYDPCSSQMFLTHSLFTISIRILALRIHTQVASPDLEWFTERESLLHFRWFRVFRFFFSIELVRLHEKETLRTSKITPPHFSLSLTFLAIWIL